MHCLVRQIEKQRLRHQHAPTGGRSGANAVLGGVRSDDPVSLRRVESGTVLATVGNLCAVVEIEAGDWLSQGGRILEAAVFDLSRPAQALVVKVAAGRHRQPVSALGVPLADSCSRPGRLPILKKVAWRGVAWRGVACSLL